MEEPDDIADDEPPVRPLLPPDDRVWRHPTEIGAVPPTAPIGPTAAPPVAPPDPHDRRSTWTVPLLSGLIGAVLTFGLVAITGGLDAERPVERELVVTERELAPFMLAEEPPAGTVVGIAENTRPAIDTVMRPPLSTTWALVST